MRVPGSAAAAMRETVSNDGVIPAAAGRVETSARATMMLARLSWVTVTKTTKNPHPWKGTEAEACRGATLIGDALVHHPLKPYGPTWTDTRLLLTGETPLPSTPRERVLGHSSRIHSAPIAHRALTFPGSLRSMVRCVLVPFIAVAVRLLAAQYGRP